MKKNNFKLFSILLSFVFGTIIFSACGQSKGNLTFNKNQITMAYQQELDISDLVTLEGCNIENVVFESDNPNIVLVTPRQTIVAGSEDGVAILTAKGYNGFMEIKVAGTNLKFSAPANLHFDEATSKVVWDGVYAGQTIANNFTVKITKDGTPLDDVIVDTNEYTIEGEGSFKVQIKSNSKDGVQESDYTNEYSFTKLPQPTNLKYDSNTGLVSWDMPEGVTHFYLKKDGVLSEKLSTNFYALNMTEAQTHTLSVYSATNNNVENVFGSASETLTLTRLSAPVVSVSDGVVSWQDDQVGVEAYSVKVYEQQANSEILIEEKTILQNGNTYSYTMPSLTQGEYFVKVGAVGSGDNTGIFVAGAHYLDSAYSQTQTTTKLEKQELAFDKATSTFSVKNFDSAENLNLKLVVVVNDGTPTQLDISSGQRTYSFDSCGTYSFYLINVSKSDKEISSEKGQTITVVKLDQIANLTQTEDEQGNYILKNLQLEHATNFDVKVSYNGGVALGISAGEVGYGKTADIFDKVGSYQIFVTARGTDSENYYVLESVTTLTTTRLETNTLTRNGEKITWQTSGTGSNIAYSYDVTGQEELSGILQTNMFDLSILSVGAYTLQINAIGKNKSNAINLVLDSFTSQSLSIEIFRQLAKPQLSFERSANGYNLIISPVANATSYTITLNSLPYKVESAKGQEPVIIAVEDCFAQAGVGSNSLEYSFDVYATSTNQYLTQSITSSVTVKKELAPTKFNVSDDETLSIDIVNNHIQRAQILINNEEINTFAKDVKTFNVKVKYITKGQPISGVYYIDSDYAEFVLERLSIEIKFYGLLVKWFAGETTQSFTPYINVVQGDNSFTFGLANMPAVDLGKFNLEMAGLSLTKAMSGYIECVFKKFSGTIAGSYQNGMFVSGTSGQLSKYNIGSKSAYTTIQYAKSNINLDVKEQGDVVNFTWTPQDGAEYILFDGKQDITGLTDSASVDSSLFSSEHTLSLTEMLNGETNVYIFYVTRLAKVGSLTVLEDETVSANLIAGATSVEITKNGEKVSNLKNVQNEEVVIAVKYIAQEKQNTYEFYIDSAKTEYTFARLTVLNTTSNLNIYNNVISWTKEGIADVSNYKYNVKFFDSLDNEEIVVLTAATTNNIDLTLSKYENILTNMSGTKYVTIQKYVGEYVANSKQTNYLSSVYSSDVLLKVIEAPTNVKIQLAEDITGINNILQNALNISWQVNNAGVEISGYKIKITHNGKTTEHDATGVFSVTEESDLFNTPGAWTVSVRALGANDSIISPYSQPTTITRLQPTTSLQLTKDGIISWSQVAGVTQYMIAHIGVAGENAWFVSKDDISSEDFKAKLNEEFAGEVTINLFALGDGETTLTSIKSAVFTRLEKPVVVFETDKAIFENFESYPTKTKIFVNATIDSNVVLNKEITPTFDKDIQKYVWVYPTDYSYVDQTGKTVTVDMSTQKQITFTFEARNEGAQYIYSNKVSSSLTILMPLVDLKVVRIDNVLHLKATNPNTNVTKVKVSMGEFAWLFEGNVDLEISDSVLAQIPSKWTFSMFAVGETVDTQIYMSSAKSNISGTKLSTVSGLSTKDGAVVWNAVSGASDYRVCVDSNVYLTGYTTSRTEKLAGKQFASGDHIINVRAIGNVTDAGLTSGIVLDGDFSASYTVTKLDALSDFNVENGYFTFTPIQQASAYIVLAYTDITANPVAEYQLQQFTQFPEDENANGYYYNPSLLTKLDELLLTGGQSAKLYIRIYNKTALNNYVYSDFAEVTYGGQAHDYVTIARLKNLNEQIELYNPLKPDQVNKDYITTIGKWEQNPNGSNSYILDIDGKQSVVRQNSFVLDEDGSWTAAKHTIKYSQIGSQGFDENGHAYLTADFTKHVTVTKLQSTEPFIGLYGTIAKELCISYSTVAGADKYYAYLTKDGNLEYFAEYQNAGIAIMMDGMLENVKYDSFGLRAVNTQDVTYLASDLCYVTIFDEETQEEKTVSLSKTNAPKGYKFNDGAFYWEYSTLMWTRMLTSMNSIVSVDGLGLSFNQLISNQFEIRFTSTTAPITTYTGVDYIRNYIYVSDSQFVELCRIIDSFVAPEGTEGGLTKETAFILKQSILEYFGGGFSSAKYNFNKFASNLPAGSYDIEIRTIGNGYVIYGDTKEYEAKFSSDYTSIGTKYIASAPSVTAVAQDGKYSLKFTNVNINETYFPDGISYKLYGTYYNKDYDINITEYVTTIEYPNINNSSELLFDLTQLIQEEKLTSKYTNLFVSVSGNNSNILNGKTSNVINIQILDPIVAKVERGIIYWNKQDYASKYQAGYLKLGESQIKYIDFAVEDNVDIYDWEAEELAEGSSYTLTLQACGLMNASINNKETFTMSGKLTEVGTVNKLAGISKLENGVDIQNGLFVWDTIENATKYDVYIKDTNDKLEVVTVGNNSFFETTVTDKNAYYYQFKAIGTDYEDLSENSNIYVNSDLSGRNFAQRLGEIKDINFDNAIISFTPVYATGNYKLTFYKLNSAGEESQPIIVYTTETIFDTNSNQSLRSAGQYKVNIQAIYTNKKLVGTTSDCYYIISSKYSENYVKFDKVYNINVGEYDITNNNITTHYEGGVISWAHDNSEGLDTSTYEYRLIFTAYTSEDVYKNQVIKTVPSSQKYFEGVVFDELDTTDKITLEIYVYPTQTAIASSTNYVYSLPVTYGTYAEDVLTDPTYLHQYMQIDEKELSIGITEKSQLMIDWTNGVSGSNTGDFTYEISFSIGGVEHEPMTTNDTFYIIGNEDEGLFADDSSTTVVLKIRVIPTSKDYISSAWTSSKEITRPSTIEGLSFDPTTCTITWDAYAGTSNWDSYKYKIRDEVTYTDSKGKTHVEVYILTANLGDEVYTPFVIGTHNVSVAVMVKNSNEANSDFISAYKTLSDIEFNMFASGAGTQENPYIIRDAQAFANMQYRMSKDAKLNEYYLTSIVDDETIVDNEKVIDTVNKYYFKQEGHITLVKNGEIDQTLYNVQSESGFNNIYDADKYSLTLDYTHVSNTTDYEHVSIFKLLGENAEIKNMRLLFNLTATNNSLNGSGNWADISVLCEQNNGKIENVMVGNAGDSITINLTNLSMSLSFLASNNYGTITNVQNNYNVTLINSNIIDPFQQTNYAPIAINNYASIIYAKNNGNITVSGSRLYVGGLIANNDGTNAVVQGGANKGNFDIFYDIKPAESSYVGGLVAYSKGASSMSYCYNIGNILIRAEYDVVLNNTYVGGLVGGTTQDNISYSYVNANFTTTVANFNVYQLIGKGRTDSQSSAQNVYYNASQNTAAINGTMGSGVKSFTTTPQDAQLYGSGTLFNKGDLDGVNPRLDWEAKLFETIEWHSDRPVA